MKKIFKLSFLALFMAVVSCDDATDIVQESELNDEAAFQSVEDLQSGLIGVYNAYGPDFGGNGNGDIILFNDLFTDNIKRGISNLGQGSQEYNFSIQPGSNPPGTIWANRYATINFANRVLRAMDRLAPDFSEADMEVANRIKGELLAMRALAHFDLLQYFSPSYTNLSAPGVIIVDFVPEIDQDLPRSTVGEVFNFVNADLTAASELLSGVVGETRFFVDANVVKAIRARVALFEGNYDLAETLSAQLVADFPLSDVDPYFNIWSVDEIADTEVIFALARLQNDPGIAANWYANRVNIEGSPFLEMSNQLFDLYDDNDIRRFAFVDDSSDLSDPDNRIILIGKYQGGANGLLINHVKVFRSSEMLLIRAECEARDGRLTEAAASLRQIWLARGISDALVPAQPTFATPNDALRAILLERRKELAFEGHRYLDLKRIGAEVGVGISRDPADCASFSAPCDLAPTDYRFTLPIPTSEISANPTIEQNPGY